MLFKADLEKIKINAKKMKITIQCLSELMNCEEAPLVTELKLIKKIEPQNKTFKQLWRFNHGLVH